MRLKTFNDGRCVKGGGGWECSGSDCKASLQVNDPACLGLPGPFFSYFRLHTFDINDYHSIRADKLDQVKADAASEIMVGLKEASNDVRKAADQLVKAAKKPPL